jgi:Flp pilus assembly protein TadG
MLPCRQREVCAPSGSSHGPAPERLRLFQARDENGQGLVEFALVAPLLLLIVFAITSFGITFNNQLKLTDAVRVGGRAAATQNDTTAACAAAESAMEGTLGEDDWNKVLDASGGDLPCTDTTVAGDAGVTITANYPYSINILGLVVRDGNLTSSATERLG